ncbi:hypothetical protein PG991_009197 [Apiospora marii]|uniref:Uncharacterized protein n=1 Tax=Apiospora marii TaxID=335849 RepID=A0ABR1RK05_9PEZI
MNRKQFLNAIPGSPLLDFSFEATAKVKDLHGNIFALFGGSVSSDGYILGKGHILGHDEHWALGEQPRDVNPMAGPRSAKVVDENGGLGCKLASGDLEKCAGKKTDDESDPQEEHNEEHVMTAHEGSAKKCDLANLLKDIMGNVTGYIKIGKLKLEDMQYVKTRSGDP